MAITCLVLKPIEKKTPLPCEAPARKEIKAFDSGIVFRLSGKMLQNIECIWSLKFHSPALQLSCEDLVQMKCHCCHYLSKKLFSN